MMHYQYIPLIFGVVFSRTNGKAARIDHVFKPPHDVLLNASEGCEPVQGKAHRPRRDVVGELVCEELAVSLFPCNPLQVKLPFCVCSSTAGLITQVFLNSITLPQESVIFLMPPQLSNMKPSLSI
jgi:hypothetical protein